MGRGSKVYEWVKIGKVFQSFRSLNNGFKWKKSNGN